MKIILKDEKSVWNPIRRKSNWHVELKISLWKDQFPLQDVSKILTVDYPMESKIS